MAESPAPRSAPVLSFNTLHDGACISIDTQLYELRTTDQLSIGMLRRVQRDTSRVKHLMAQAEMTDAEQSELSSLLGSICAAIVDAPPEALTKLGDVQRVAVLETFTRLRLTTTPAAATPTTAREENRSPGKKRSRGSRGSTAARGKTGTGASR